MKKKRFEIVSKVYTFLYYDGNWVLPIFETYSQGLGSPIAMSLYTLVNSQLELYCVVTCNMPNSKRGAGCQFIDVNNNNVSIVDWLMDNGFGDKTGNIATSGFCKYPEFNFYKGESFWKYRDVAKDIFNSHK